MEIKNYYRYLFLIVLVSSSMTFAMYEPTRESLQNVLLRPHSNFYAVLHINLDAKPQEIQEAYDRLSTLFNPDNLQKNRDELYELRVNDKQAREYFEKVKKAYKTLSNAKQKSKYDTALAAAIEAKKVAAEEAVAEEKRTRGELPRIYIPKDEWQVIEDYSPIKQKKLTAYEVEKPKAVFLMSDEEEVLPEGYLPEGWEALEGEDDDSNPS